MKRLLQIVSTGDGVYIIAVTVKMHQRYVHQVETAMSLIFFLLALPLIEELHRFRMNA